MTVQQVRTEALARLPLLAGLDESVLQRLALQSEALTFSKGQLISLEGDPCPAVFLISQGVVQLRQLSHEGREHVLGYVGAGGCVHLAAALDGAYSLTTVESLTAVVLYAIEAQSFLRAAEECPGLAVAISRCLADDVCRLTAMVKDLALHSVRTRLARFLLAHAEGGTHSAGRPIPHTWTQDVIAARIGTVRDVVGRTLRAFGDEGLIRRERGKLVILDRAGLQREAQSEDPD